MQQFDDTLGFTGALKLSGCSCLKYDRYMTSPVFKIETWHPQKYPSSDGITVLAYHQCCWKINSMLLAVVAGLSSSHCLYKATSWKFEVSTYSSDI